MSILIYTEHQDGFVKKQSLEAICYGVAIATSSGEEAVVLVVGETTADLSSLGKYGVTRVLHVPSFSALSDTKAMAAVIDQAANSISATTVIFSNTITGKSVAPRVAVRLKAGFVSGVISLPDTSNGFRVNKNVFSGKAVTEIQVNSSKRVITLQPNAFEISAGEGVARVSQPEIAIPASTIMVKEIKKTTGAIPLAEADRVISGGRGLKGPENWGMIEELAQLTGAATACSRAVADAHWRPHHEHVGQTGLAISPNLYFAVGISGAIQHLAGVNRSKTIVVINKDPEAPFFKSADYGIVGDAFEVMPKIIQAVKELG
ncbi:MAG: electron transfer flavoprotein subunit alpha/FixB family protein [Bacteroidota bacterium]